MKKKNTIQLHIPDMPAQLQATAKAMAAIAGKTLKAWVKEAIQEKIEKEASRHDPH